MTRDILGLSVDYFLRLLKDEFASVGSFIENASPTRDVQTAHVGRAQPLAAQQFDQGEFDLIPFVAQKFNFTNIFHATPVKETRSVA